MQAHSGQRRNVRKARSSFTISDNPHISRSADALDVVTGPSQIKHSTQHLSRKWTSTAQDISQRKLPLANGFTKSNANLRASEQLNGIRSDQRPTRFRQQTNHLRVRGCRNDTGATFTGLHSGPPQDQCLNAIDGRNDNSNVSRNSRDKLDRAHQATETFLAQLPPELLPPQLSGASAGTAKAFLAQFASSILKANSAVGEQYKGSEDAEALWVSDEDEILQPSGTSKRDKSSMTSEVDRQTMPRFISTKQKRIERRPGRSAINDDAARNHENWDSRYHATVASDLDSGQDYELDDPLLGINNAVYQDHGLGAPQTADEAKPKRQGKRESARYSLQSTSAPRRMPLQWRHMNSRKAHLATENGVDFPSRDIYEEAVVSRDRTSDGDATNTNVHLNHDRATTTRPIHGRNDTSKNMRASHHGRSNERTSDHYHDSTGFRSSQVAREAEKGIASSKAGADRLQSTLQPIEIPETWLVLHKTKCPDSQRWATFIDEPELVDNDWSSRYDREHHQRHWDARSRVSAKRLREIEANSTPFIVYREYECALLSQQEDSDVESGDARQGRHTPLKRRRRSSSGTRSRSSDNTESIEHDRPKFNLSSAENASERDTVRESVQIVSRDLRRAIADLAGRIPGLQAYEKQLNSKGSTLRAPYYFFYHFEEEMAEYVERLKSLADRSRSYKEFRWLLAYLSSASHALHMEAESIFRRGLVKTGMIPYLFKPNSILLCLEDGEPICKTQDSTISISYEAPTNDPEVGKWTDWTMYVSTYSYNGQFRVTGNRAFIKIPARQSWLQKITSLPFYPLEYAPANVRDMLVSRGHKFFRLCRKHYVIYTGDSGSNDVNEANSASIPRNEQLSDQHQTQVRYMIDGEAYRLIHEDEEAESERKPKRRDRAEVVTPDENDVRFLSQLPAFVNGYHMVNKKWLRLLVREVYDVPWNKQAFNNLAAEDDTKMLIEALITNKINSNESVDFVQGKGTGLIVLLHGGPGTGKTLTAESVAEIAEKPLYRVSCGDIGTEAAQVEEYLTSVFYLGRRWGSVVLLDEADIFLEERSLDNLQRNALVSVFLRMIEYYDGILVLTSNRVGIFDEAFKSRIQLSLYYPNLDQAKRRQIWTNFVGRLEALKEDMQTADIKKHIDDLAAYNMNGRQIRNAITSARQLSRFKKQKLNFASLKNVIEVGQRFETYLLELKGHSDEDWAREERIR